MYGDIAIKLLKEIYKKDRIINYNDDYIRNIITEIDQLYNIMKQINRTYQMEKKKGNKASDSLQLSFQVHSQAILRNKRCVLAYLLHRINMIQTHWWKESSILSDEIKSKLSTSEQRLFQDYNRINSKYMSHMDISLKSSLEPPNSLWKEVYVLKTVSGLMIESGVRHLEKHTREFLLHSDCEMLSLQGIVEEV